MYLLLNPYDKTYHQENHFFVLKYEKSHKKTSPSNCKESHRKQVKSTSFIINEVQYDAIEQQ